MRVSKLQKRLSVCATVIASQLVFLATAYAQEGRITARQAYPTGDMASSIVAIERTHPREIRSGEAFTYELKVTNLTQGKIEGAMLTEEVPDGFAVSDVTPPPDSTDGRRYSWMLGTLGARQSKVYRFSGSATSVGELHACANIKFDTTMCSRMQVVMPALELVKTAPAEVMVCDPIPLQFVVTNTGSGMARGVTIVDTLPEGWTSDRGGRELSMPVGDLGPGQSARVSVQVKSSSTGSFTNRAFAREDGGLTAEATASTRVTKPVLSVSKSGPDVRYIGRAAEFTITVRNDGDAEARNTMLVDSVPAGMRFDMASDQGTASGSNVQWNLGTIPPGGSRTVSVTLTPTNIGVKRNTAQARAYCAEASAEAVMESRGIPAILLEVVDLDDPIEVGANVTYEIKVLNQGSADGTNISVTCSLPSEQEYVSSAGPTQGSVEGADVRFAPLPVLAPKAVATYRVTVRCRDAANVRFKVSLVSDQLERPVEETESTNQY